jgi:hypothetical protein
MLRSRNYRRQTASRNSTAKRLRGRARNRGAITRQLRRLPVANRSQFEWPGIRAFVAPMPLRTVQPLPRPATITNKNFFSHLRIVSTLRVADCQTLFAENFFYLAHFFLDRPAYFLRRAAILHVRIARRLAGLFFDRALGLLHAPFDFVLRARLHTNESAFARPGDGPRKKSPIVRGE